MATHFSHQFSVHFDLMVISPNFSLPCQNAITHWPGRERDCCSPPSGAQTSPSHRSSYKLPPSRHDGSAPHAPPFLSHGAGLYALWEATAPLLPLLFSFLAFPQSFILFPGGCLCSHSCGFMKIDQKASPAPGPGLPCPPLKRHVHVAYGRRLPLTPSPPGSSPWPHPRGLRSLNNKKARGRPCASLSPP